MMWFTIAPQDNSMWQLHALKHQGVVNNNSAVKLHVSNWRQAHEKKKSKKEVESWWLFEFQVLFNLTNLVTEKNRLLGFSVGVCHVVDAIFLSI